jgi:hypothetical protein
VSWSTAESFDFCFLGVPWRSIVAIATVGLRPERPLEYQLFLDGFRKMVQRLLPSLVLCYGSAPAGSQELAEIRCYPARWEGIRATRKIHGLSGSSLPVVRQ